MDLRIRKTRTLRVIEIEPTPEEREGLAQLYADPRYEFLLNVMERGCIALETAHLNTSAGDVEEILGGHAVAKSAWLFFTWTQKAVLNAYNTREGEPEPVEEASLEDLLQGVEGFPE